MMRRQRRLFRGAKSKKIIDKFLLLLINMSISRSTNTGMMIMTRCFTSLSLSALPVQALSSSSSSFARRQPGNSKAASKTRVIAVIGGGASGIFAAISAAEHYNSLLLQHQQSKQQQQLQQLQVVVLEGSQQTLKKVKISGGGRCNVMHDTSRFMSIRDLLTTGYPRGYKELNGIFSEKKNTIDSSFSPNQVRIWFEQQPLIGKLKTESDGRMFPRTDSSQTIIDALLQAAAVTKRVEIYKNCLVQDIIPLDNNNDNNNQHQSPPRFRIQIKEKMTRSETSNNNNDYDDSSSSSTSLLNDVKKKKNQSYSYLEADAVILATGSSSLGYQIAATLGHVIVPPVPSLFTLQTKYAMAMMTTTNDENNNHHDHDDANDDTRGLLYGLSGLSVPMARVSFVPDTLQEEEEQDDKHDDSDDAASSAAIGSSDTTVKKKSARKNNKSSKKRKTLLLQQEGPLLITHRGLSGPAILRLSAFGALDFYKAKYRGELRIHWAPLAFNSNTVDEVAQELWQQTTLRPKKTILSGCPLLIETTTTDTLSSSSSLSMSSTTTTTTTATTTATAAIPRRLWASLARAAGCQDDQVWASCSKKLVRKLAMLIADCRIQVTGKDVFKEEFVTAGGIDLKQIDMRTMQSKICPGLYVCGEVINVDGVTGGFNFLNCWSTGHVAGVHAATTTATSSSSSMSSTTTTTTTP